MKRKVFIETMQGDYIVGYSYFNGYRIEHLYVSKVYRGQYSFVFDYTGAKTMSRAAAYKHQQNIIDKGIY